LLSLSATAQVRGRLEWRAKPQGNAIGAIRLPATSCMDGRSEPMAILYTTDGGFRWEHQPTRLVNSLNGLYVFDPSMRLPSEPAAHDCSPRNGGEKWVSENLFNKRITLIRLPLLADTPARGWVVGTCGCILATIDGSANGVTQKGPTQARPSQFHSLTKLSRSGRLVIAAR
jgi:photosystem II stability/assembly factor-like uncharacterized protein